MSEFNNFDFDLPTVETKPPTKPRVTIAGDVCIACEG